MYRLSDELKHCLDNSGCEKCKYFEQSSILSCRNLLQTVYNRIKEYEDLEEHGKLVRLPCAVGEKIYGIQIFSGGGRMPNWGEVYEGKFILETYEKFGKTVFLTKEEAKAALKEMTANDLSENISETPYNGDNIGGYD